MGHRFEIGAVVKAKLKKILGSAILMILYTNSKFLYECLVKLNSTQEKQMMVDVISLRQSYKQREITKVK